MSVGGEVVETIVLRDKVWINTDDGGGTCAIMVERTPEARSITEGDVVWWHGRVALWTPRIDPPPFTDKKLRRIGYSGVPRPLEAPDHE